MIFAEVLPLEIFASRHLRSSLLSFTTNLLFAMIIPLVGSTRHGKNQCSRKIATPLFSWCNPLALKYPITGIFFCARTASGQAAAAPPSAAMNSRRRRQMLIYPSLCEGLREGALSRQLSAKGVLGVVAVTPP